jgi:hypothetical protein
MLRYRTDAADKGETHRDTGKHASTYHAGRYSGFGSHDIPMFDL